MLHVSPVSTQTQFDWHSGRLFLGGPATQQATHQLELVAGSIAMLAIPIR